MTEGNYDDAVNALNRSSAIVERALGRQSHLYGLNLTYLAVVRWKQADYAGAASFGG